MTRVQAALDGWGGIADLPHTDTRRRLDTRYKGKHPRLTLLPEGREMYRMHNHPHLYPRWLRESMDDAWTAYITGLGKVSWDCTWCLRTVATDDERTTAAPTINTRCPNCGH